MVRAVGSADPWGPQLTCAAWLQHLQPGSNLRPLGHFLMTGGPGEQMRNELHLGSDGFGTTDPILFTRQGFPVKMEWKLTTVKMSRFDEETGSGEETK